MNSNYFSFLNAGISLLFSRLTKKYSPWYVNYTITNKCNLKCMYCYIDTNIKGRKDPTLEEIKNNIECLYKLGTRFLCLLGGEPLLRSDISEIVSYIKKNKKNMLIAISTNGIYIDKHIDVLRKVNKVTISLEGNKEKHDKDRGVGTYDKITSNMRLLKSEEIHNFSIQTTISTNTADTWEHVLYLAKEIGCSVLITEIASHPDENFKEADLGENQFFTLWSRIWELKKKGFPIENSFEAISNIIGYSKYVSPYQIYNDYGQMPEPLRKFAKKNMCPMGKYSAFLDTDGTFYPCASLFGITGYNVHELSFEKAFMEMASNVSCKACRMSISCQMNYLFSSINPITLSKLALQALKNYNYKQ